MIVSLSQETQGWASDIQGKPFVSAMRTIGNVQDSSQLQVGAHGDLGVTELNKKGRSKHIMH